MTPSKPPTHDGRCGSYRGVMAHRHRGEYPCPACAEARRLEHEDRRKAASRRAVLAEAVGDGSYGGIAGGS